MLPIPFRNPSTYDGHSGVDFGQPEGTPIRASGLATVSFVGWWNDRAGYSTILDYPTCRVLYCHQPANAERPTVGLTVHEGDIIGRVGSTGRSTGPHLHMEIMQGKGAHTYKGIWNYFTSSRVVGEGEPAGSESEYTEGDEEMYIAVVGKRSNAKFYLIQNVKGQPTGHLLGSESGARESGLPIINYPWDWDIAQLKQTTKLLG